MKKKQAAFVDEAPSWPTCVVAGIDKISRDVKIIVVASPSPWVGGILSPKGLIVASSSTKL